MARTTNRRPTGAVTAPPPVNSEDAALAAEHDYLTRQRAAEPANVAAGMEPYHYVPTIIGFAWLSFADYTVGELVWVLNEYTRIVAVNKDHWPTIAARAQKTLDAALAVATQRGIKWSPPVTQPAANWMYTLNPTGPRR